MARCKNCPGLLVGPRHFREHPDHEPVIGNISPGGRKILLDQINNQRMYSRLSPQAMQSEQSRLMARRQARALRNIGVDVRKYVAGHDDYAEQLEGADIEIAPTSSDSKGSSWWVAIPVAIIIGIGIVILSNKSNGDSTNNLNEDDSHNLPFYPVDALESEMDIYYS